MGRQNNPVPIMHNQHWVARNRGKNLKYENILEERVLMSISILKCPLRPKKDVTLTLTCGSYPSRNLNRNLNLSLPRLTFLPHRSPTKAGHALPYNSPTCSQAPGILCDSPCREAFGVRRIPALSFRPSEISLDHAKAQRRDAAHSKRFARLGCGFVPPCHTLLFLALSLATILPASAAPHAGPLFDHFDLTLAPGHRTEAAGPFFYLEENETTRTWAVPPLFSHTRDDATDYE